MHRPDLPHDSLQRDELSAAPALTLDTPALITTRGGVVTVSSEAEGLPVAVYATDGRMYGSATVSNGQATVGTSLTDGSVAIVKLGQKTVKVVMRDEAARSAGRQISLNGADEMEVNTYDQCSPPFHVCAYRFVMA